MNPATNQPDTGFAIHIDPAALTPLIDAAVTAALARAETGHGQLNGKIAYTENEAARLLSLEYYQLRDERRRGRITASVGPGRRILYSKTDLLEYLATRKWRNNRDRHG